ncbi:histamine N-methyltransferase B-like [Glandiceps talaboti]
MTTMKSLSSNAPRYLQSFKEFLQVSDEHKVMTDWVEVGITEITDKLSDTSNDKKLTVLGVGSGSGEIDIHILGTVAKRYQNIYNCVIEPSVDQMKKYKSNVKEHKALDIVDFDWRNQTAEEYMASTEQSQFDLVHMIQMLYYVDNTENTILQFYYKYLKTNGIMVLLQVSSNGGWENIWREFGDRLLQSDGCTYTTGKNIQDILERNKIKYKTTILPSYFYINQCFKENSKIGSLLLDFITEVDDFTNTAPDDLRCELVEYLKTSNCSYQDDDNIVFKNDLQVFIITKD